jgi:L-rhamnose isomerase / sugar isomerase
VYERLGPDQRMLLEYKLFEPSFYTTDVPDWGTSLLHCVTLGPQAQVVVDTGHHAPGTNIEFIVALLLRAGRLGGFDFNSRFYADDDLMVGAADPFQLFRIMHEVVKAGALAPAAGVAFMLDQCHNIEPKIPAQIRSVMNVQEATAKALLVGTDALAGAQQSGDVLGANAALMDAYNTDVRPLLAELRHEAGLEPDPVAAYQRSGYAEKIVAERTGGAPAGWGALDERRQSRRGTDRAVEPARVGPAEHELRGGQHLGQGHRDRPGDRSGRGPVVGQGFGR